MQLWDVSQALSTHVCEMSVSSPFLPRRQGEADGPFRTTPVSLAPGLSQSVFGSGMVFTFGQFLSARAMFSAVFCRQTSRQCIELLR